MLTIQLGKLTQIIHKELQDGVIRVLCKVRLKKYGLLDCYCSENEFPIHFLPLLVDSELSISTFTMYLDHLKAGFTELNNNELKPNGVIDLSKFIPTRILPYPNQSMHVHAHLFNSLQMYGTSYQSLIDWAPEKESNFSRRKELHQQLFMLERLYQKSQGDPIDPIEDEEDS